MSLRLEYDILCVFVCACVREREKRAEMVKERVSVCQKMTINATGSTVKLHESILNKNEDLIQLPFSGCSQ